MQFITLPAANSFHKFIRESPAYEEYLRVLSRNKSTITPGTGIYTIEFSTITVPVDSTVHQAYQHLVNTFPEWFI